MGVSEAEELSVISRVEREAAFTGREINEVRNVRRSTVKTPRRKESVVLCSTISPILPPKYMGFVSETCGAKHQRAVKHSVRKFVHIEYDEARD